MSRARQSTHVYVVADDIRQATDDLTREWSTERREQWLLDTDTPAADSTRRDLDLAPRVANTLRAAHLRAERDAVTAVAPWATERLRAIDVQARLEALQTASADRHPGLGLG